ncbi:MAG: hypothetical protein ACSHYF_12780 [Verrucomicrobiaceae bacterium]
MVDRFSRNDVVAFWHRYYKASEGYENRWSGTIDYANCSLSEPPAEFTKDIQRRVNYYRAMAGLPGNTSFETAEVYLDADDRHTPPAGTTKSQATRAIALALSSQGFDIENASEFQLTHDLPDDFSCFSPTAWNGSRNSNLAVHIWGPGAIDGYMDEPGDGVDELANRFVGHRRWLLFSAVAKMASGDIPPEVEDGLLTRPAVNALYVLGDFTLPRQVQFVAWPNAGYCPSPIVSDLWSLSYPGADFSAAKVTMSGPDGATVPAPIVSQSKGIPLSGQVTNVNGEGPIGKSATGPGSGDYADSTLVWMPTGLPDEVDEDQTYKVTVQNIGGGGPTSFTYHVTIINPDVLQPMKLTGSEHPPVEGANYYFGPVRGADSYDFEISQRSGELEVEDAESDSPAIIDQSVNGVDLVGAFSFPKSIWPNSDFFLGEKSFRLAFKDNTPTAHGFEINHNLTTNKGATLKFQYRRGFMTTKTHLDVEISVDGGVSWQKTDFRVSGLSTNLESMPPDSKFIQAVVPLPESPSLRVRFRQSWEVNTLIGWNQTIQDEEHAMGVFIDDISFANAELAVASVVHTLDGSHQQIAFNPEVLGGGLLPGETYNIRIRPKIAGFAFAWSPIEEVKVIESTNLRDYDYWSAYVYPSVGEFGADFDSDGLSNGHEYALGTSPIKASEGTASFELEKVGSDLCVAVPANSMAPGVTYRAEWSSDLVNWTDTGVVVSDHGGRLKAVAPVQDLPNAYIRWVISPK